MINLQTIVHDPKMKAYPKASPKNFQEFSSIKSKPVKGKTPEKNSFEIVLFHGGCIV